MKKITMMKCCSYNSWNAINQYWFFNIHKKSLKVTIIVLYWIIWIFPPRIPLPAGGTTPTPPGDFATVYRYAKVIWKVEVVHRDITFGEPCYTPRVGIFIQLNNSNTTYNVEYKNRVYTYLFLRHSVYNIKKWYEFKAEDQLAYFWH